MLFVPTPPRVATLEGGRKQRRGNAELDVSLIAQDLDKFIIDQVKLSARVLSMLNGRHRMVL